MPSILNPSNDAYSPDFQDAVRSILVTYAGNVFSSLAPVTAGNLGYKAYQKLIAFSERVGANPDAYKEQASLLISQIEPNMLNTVQNNNQQFYRWLYTDNPAGRNILECEPTVGSYNHVGIQTSKSIYDVLAGVSQLDLL